MLEPIDLILEAEKKGKNHERLALMEETKTLPFSAVWDAFCEKQGVPVGPDWIAKVDEYEKTELSKRA